MEGFVHFEYLFSYWIFIWFLIYYNIDAFKGTVVSWIKKTANPLLALWLAFWFNTYEIVYMSLIKFDIVLIVKFCIMILFVKALPIYLLYRKGLSIHWANDTVIFAALVSLYIMYL
jgi:hypothetical protein